MEILDIINKENKVIGKATREKTHKKGLIHKSVMFFIFDKNERVFVNQRSTKKEFYPAYWSIALGGHVSSKETYESTVIREVKEEVGIEGKPIFITSFKKRYDKEDKENVRVYAYVTEQKLKLDPRELENGQFMTMEELEEKMKIEKFLPETIKLYQILKDYKSNKKHDMDRQFLK